MRIGKFASSAAVLPMLCVAVHGDVFAKRRAVEGATATTTGATATAAMDEACYAIETQVLDFTDFFDAKDYGGLEWSGSGKVIDLTADLGGDLIDTSKLQESVNGLTGGLTTPAAYRADFDGLGLKSLNAPSLSAPGNCNFGVGLLKVTAPEGGSVTFTGVKATGAACTRGPFVFDENHKTEIVDLTGCGTNLKKLTLTSNDAHHVLIDQLQVVAPSEFIAGDMAAPELFLMSNSPIEATDVKGGVVDFKVAVLDDVDKSIKPLCTLQTEDSDVEVPLMAGQKLPLGDNFVTCTAQDSQGLDNIITEVITVQDTTAPKFVTPKTFTTAPDDKKTCAYSIQAVDNTKGMFAPVCEPASGMACSAGDNISIKCTAADDHDNSATETFTMQVRAKKPPTLTVPDSVTLKAPEGAAGMPFEFKATALDALGANIKTTCNHASGTLFPIGSTTVTCSATDGLLNSERSFLVTVLPPATTVVPKPVVPAVPAVPSLPSVQDAAAKAAAEAAAAAKKAGIVSSGEGVQAAPEEEAAPVKTAPASSPASMLQASSALKVASALVLGAACLMALW